MALPWSWEATWNWVLMSLAFSVGFLGFSGPDDLVSELQVDTELVLVTLPKSMQCCCSWDYRYI